MSKLGALSNLLDLSEEGVSASSSLTIGWAFPALSSRTIDRLCFDVFFTRSPGYEG